jgi:hypothetical protein
LAGTSASAEVTIHNYVRAGTDLQMRTYVVKFDCFKKFFHVREAYDIDQNFNNGRAGSARITVTHVPE